MENKYVYLFSEGNASMRNLLGGKGANLAEMTNLGIPVPQGFTVTTEACNKYYADGKKISQEVLEQIESSIKELEKITGKTYDRIHVVGGGANAGYLNELTAKYCKKPVYAGPTEATALGNLAVQMMYSGELKDLVDARACIKESFDIKIYE